MNDEEHRGTASLPTVSPVQSPCVRSQLQALLCLVDIASGMTYLHSVGVLHGDLKSANVLLKSTATDLRGFCCKIADFGCFQLPPTALTC